MGRDIPPLSADDARAWPQPEPAARRGRRRSPWPAVALVVLLPVTGWVFWESQRVFRADWASAAERRQVLDWVAGTASPTSAAEWDGALAALQRSLALTPDDPELHERLGDLYAAAGQRDWADTALRRAAFSRAVAHYRDALTLRPVQPQTWAMLAAASQAMEAGPAEVQRAWDRALALGPHEGHVQPVLLQVALADWDRASPGMRAWAVALFDGGDAGTRAAINTMARRYALVFTADVKDDAGRKPGVTPTP